MSRHVLLNNVDHHALRVDTRRLPGLGDEVMSVLTFPGEFRHLQAYYPIVFHKDAQGGFHPLALLGLRQDENLFLDERGWEVPYLPLAIERKPFLIGNADGEPMVHVDLDSPRILGEEDAGDAGQAKAAFVEAQSELMRAVSKGLIHKNTGSRKVSRLATQLKKLSVA